MSGNGQKPEQRGAEVRGQCMNSSVLSISSKNFRDHGEHPRENPGI